MDANQEQPKPTATDRAPMWPAVIAYVKANYVDNDPEIVDEKYREGNSVTRAIADMVQRHEVGIARYGVPLTSGNGRNALLDAYQEALDLAVYLHTELDERGIAPVHPMASRPIRDRDKAKAPDDVEDALIKTFGLAVEVCLQLRGMLDI